MLPAFYERSDIIHPPWADIKFMLIEKDSENSIMCSVWFDRNAVICPHVIKIKIMLLSDLAVCKSLLMHLKLQFWAKKKCFYSCCSCYERKEEKEFLIDYWGRQRQGSFWFGLQLPEKIQEIVLQTVSLWILGEFHPFLIHGSYGKVCEDWQH